MKRVICIIGSLILIMLMLGLAGCDISGSIGTNPNQTSGIWVTGEGKVTVTPDVAILSVGVQTENSSVAQAQEQASVAMNAVLKALKDNDIADKDVQTQYFSISPVRNYVMNTGEQNITGYRVDNSLTVKIRKVDDAAKIIDAVTAAGGNNIVINSISFTVEDPTTYQKDAREKALDNAKMKAQEIATKAGLTLGEPTFLNETSSYNPPYSGIMASAIPTPVIVGSSVNAGEIEVTVYIQVAYSIK
ncbi:MAG: SIMPL domain-containing protein [Dehalococcoidales bacterium]